MVLDRSSRARIAHLHLHVCKSISALVWLARFGWFLIMAIVPFDPGTLVETYEEEEPLHEGTLVEVYEDFSTPSAVVSAGWKWRFFRAGFKVQVIVFVAGLNLCCRRTESGIRHIPTHMHICTTISRLECNDTTTEACTQRMTLGL